MTDKALVVDIKDGIITVMPMIKSGCAGCTAECDKKSSTFPVENSLGLDVKVGSTVRLKAAKKAMMVQGLISILLPVACSVAGYFLATPICSLFGRTAGEDSKALGVLIPFMISSILVFVFTRKFKMPGTPDIAEIL